ncbi:DMT family transporter [Aquiflexum lacus]|uniref:DMT family transporter n=1 Tax=Aquiflexum lacus TaxID=2483805 RepID=UPI001893815F|nr:DMT family transporter [Aquiflexum lacus]
MQKIIWIILVLLAGGMLPVQAGLNAKVGRIIESPVHASLISFLVGSIGLFTYVLISRLHFQASEIKNIPIEAWGAGILGAIYVTIIILAFPRLGAALTFGLVVAGQLFLSLLLDHYKILVLQPHTFSLQRLGGVVLIIIGVLVIRKF